MGKSKAPSETSQTTKVEYPEWVDEAAKANLDLADTLASKPYNPYTGQLLASISPYTTQSQNALVNMANTDPFGSVLATGTGQVLNDLGYTPSNLASPTYDRSAVRQLNPSYLTSTTQQLMDPYINDVVNGTVNKMNDARLQTLQQTGDQAQMRNAFGGDRHGIMEAQVNNDFINNVGNITGQLKSAGWNQAMNTAQTAGQFDAGQDAAGQLANLQSQMSTDQFNQTTGLDAMKNRLAASQILNASASAEQANALNNANLLANVGQQQSAYDQQQLSLAYNQWLEDQNYPRNMLDLRVQALGGTPYGQTTTGTGTSPVQSGNPLAGALGGAMAGASLGSMMAAPGATGLAAVGGMPFLLGGALLGGLLS